MKNMYKEIKEQLLNNENIYDVKINSNRGILTIKPRQDKSYFTMSEPLEDFKNEDNRFDICGVEFRLYKYDHYNTQIFELQLKEIA